MQKLLFIFGTRPEAIKMAPLIRQFSRFADAFDVTVCVTAQHREMLDQVLDFFGLHPDFDLNLMAPDQDLFDVTANGLKELRHVIHESNPDFIFVQGDTTSAFIGALSGFYTKTRVCHIESGLRSFHKYSPFPEEINRVLTDHIADFHFAPTEQARENLNHEGISENVHVVGNTVIDALMQGLEIIRSEGEDQYASYFSSIDFSKKVILVTGHRRESFGKPFAGICQALKDIAASQNVEIVYPVHLNPHVQEPVHGILGDVPNVHLLEPLPYPHFIWLMEKSYLILTDSGGIQEEAPSLGKPVLVMRDVTERMEGIEAGTARLTGTSTEKIVREVADLLTNDEAYRQMTGADNPYGDGTSCEAIVNIIKQVK